MASWLERASLTENFSEESKELEASNRLSRIGRELLKLKDVRNQTVHGIGTGIDDTVQLWITTAYNLGTVLSGIETIPEGSGRLAALELAKGRAEALNRILPGQNKLRLFTSNLIRLIERASSNMLANVTLEISVDPKEVVVGIPTELYLHLQNNSSVALRSVRVTTEPNIGGDSITYIAEKSRSTIPLTVRASNAAPFQFTTRWEAVRIDGASTRGEAQIELIARSTRAAILSADLGPSPYIVGNPVDRQEMFFGRQDVLDRIRRQLGSATSANVILPRGKPPHW